MAMQLFCLPLFLVCVSLQLAAFGQCEAAGDEDIDPRELARQLRSERCMFNFSLVKEFYREHKENENRDYQFPDQAVTGEETYDVSYGGLTPKIHWYIQSLLPILSPHFGPRLETITVDVFTWCLHLLSTSNIYGCMNSTHQWGTPGFKALGFFDIMSLQNKSGPGLAIFNKGQLLLDLSKDLDYSVLQATLASCTIKVPNNETVGVYKRLNLEESNRHSLQYISSQSEAYLIEGQAKNFTCESYGSTLNGHFWYQRDRNGQLTKVFTPDHFELQKTINGSTLYQLRYRDEDPSGCHSLFAHNNMLSHTRNVLAFVSPTVNNTGELKCAVGDGESDDGRSIFIAVVFTKLPLKQKTVKKGASAELVCEVKAPSDSVVYFSQKQVDKNECLLPFLTENSLGVNMTAPLCNSTTVVNKTKEEVDNKFSLFRLELQIPEMSVNHTGEYSCNVDYKIENQTENYLIHQYSNVFIDDNDKGVEKGSRLSQYQVAGILLGIFFFCLLVGASITVGLVLWVKHFKRNRRRKRTVRLPKGIKNELYHEVSLLSPGIGKSHPFEFPRSNVELQDILGEGRFGKVYKGRARGIVPDTPHLNTVAIKTTANDQLHMCTQQLLSELEIMTSIQPHENICNLLASCTSPDGPLYIIIEYASHGNLKDYLGMCREVLLQRNIVIRISSEKDEICMDSENLMIAVHTPTMHTAERPHLQQLLISCGTEGSEPNTPSEACSDVLQFTVPTLRSTAQESNQIGYDHLPPANSICEVAGDKATAQMWSSGYDRLSALEERDRTSSVTVPTRVTVSTREPSPLEANLGYDHLSPTDEVCEVREENAAATMWSTGYDRLSAVNEVDCDSNLDVVFSTTSSSLITNSSLCDFARQIASGLQHLENSNIIHCDLAARNILIAEGFLLKIGDFGMARCMSSDPRYQNFQSTDESMVAIRWAAPEVLENEVYSFKSDIWSFATVVWEIASYGSKPFGDFAVGASLEPFIQHLKDGNRLPQSEGLRDSVYKELCSCWSADPSARPSASALVECFQKLRESQ